MARRRCRCDFFSTSSFFRIPKSLSFTVYSVFSSSFSDLHLLAFFLFFAVISCGRRRPLLLQVLLFSRRRARHLLTFSPASVPSTSTIVARHGCSPSSTSPPTPPSPTSSSSSPSSPPLSSPSSPSPSPPGSSPPVIVVKEVCIVVGNSIHRRRHVGPSAESQ